LGPSHALTTSWVSSTALLCATAAGTGANRAVIMTVGRTIGSSGPYYTFDAPAITDRLGSNRNVVLSQGSFLSIAGLNFGSYDATPTGRLGSTTCLSTSWSTTTSLRCAPMGGSGLIGALVVRVRDIDGKSSRRPFPAVHFPHRSAVPLRFVFGSVSHFSVP
jgi:hypothetical protein